jgi:acyl-CoA thioester hydrolase
VLSAARFTHPIEVRFRDLDALGHVNNAVYLTYLESARIAYWLHVTRRSGLDALDMILARVEIDYRSPLSYGEAVDVTVRCVSMRRSSFVLEFAATERAGGRLVAEARKVLVHYDYGQSRSLALPPELRDLLRTQDPDVKDEAAP